MYSENLSTNYTPTYVQNERLYVKQKKKVITAVIRLLKRLEGATSDVCSQNVA